MIIHYYNFQKIHQINELISSDLNYIKSYNELYNINLVYYVRWYVFAFTVCHMKWSSLNEYTTQYTPIAFAYFFFRYTRLSMKRKSQSLNQKCFVSHHIHVFRVWIWLKSRIKNNDLIRTFFSSLVPFLFPDVYFDFASVSTFSTHFTVVDFNVAIPFVIVRFIHNVRCALP